MLYLLKADPKTRVNVTQIPGVDAYSVRRIGKRGTPIGMGWKVSGQILARDYEKVT